VTARTMVLVLLVVLVISCSAAEDQTNVKNRKENPVFEDAFDKGLVNWKTEGPHTVEARDGRLYVKTPGDSKTGQYVWCRTELPDDFRITWDVTPLSKSGFFLIFFCQKGVKGEDILGKDLFDDYMNWKTWGAYEDFDKYVSAPNRKAHHQSRIRGYHISYRRNENANCNFRKNPGLNLLLSHPVDALLPKDKTAHAELTRIGGRVKLAIDGKVFMDHIDPGEPWSGGRFGFRNVYESDGYYDNVKVFDLTKARGE